MKTVCKKVVAITGGNGLIGSNFIKKLSNKYKILKYPHRIEKIRKFNNWIKKNDFDYFIHFAAITNTFNKTSQKRLNLINEKLTIKILENLNKKKNNKLKYFLFISSSHVYNYSNIRIKENFNRKPKSNYGISKLNVENFILRNRNKFGFKLGIARIFNTTGEYQKKGYFVRDVYEKLKNNKKIYNINKYRDFIHIDDITKSIDILLKLKFDNPINISSGKKINLVKVCKLVNKFFLKKKLISLEKNRGKDLFGNNELLKTIGMKKFKDINQIIKSFKI